MAKRAKGFFSHMEELNEPIIPIGQSRESISSDQINKLPLLAAHYGIDTEAAGWMVRVLLCLAEEFVPGFQVTARPPRRTGRPPGSRKIDRRKLVKDVAELKQSQPSLDVLDALKILRKRKEYKEHSVPSLEARYYDGLREYEEERATLLESIETLEKRCPSDKGLAALKKLFETLPPSLRKNI
jgi:hypothetical protein